MDIALQRLRLGRDGRSEMLTGLRGVGKTVLLNEFEQLAEGRGYFHEHVEVSEDGDLPARLASAFRRVLLAMDARRRIGERVRRALGVLKAFTIRLPDGPELSIDVDAVSRTGRLRRSGHRPGRPLRRARRGRPRPRHRGPRHDRRAPLRERRDPRGPRHGSPPRRPAAPSRSRSPGPDSRRWPPSPARPSPTPSGCSPSPSSAPSTAARPAEALVVPAADEGVRWTEEAALRVVEVTQGFPYFLQEFGKQAWDAAEGPEIITWATSRGASRWPPPSSTTASSGSGRAGPATPSGPISGPWPSSAPVPSARARWPPCWGRRRRPSVPPGTASSRRPSATRRAGARSTSPCPCSTRFMKRWIPDLAAVVDRPDL